MGWWRETSTIACTIETETSVYNKGGLTGRLKILINFLGDIVGVLCNDYYKMSFIWCPLRVPLYYSYSVVSLYFSCTYFV